MKQKALFVLLLASMIFGSLPAFSRDVTELKTDWHFYPAYDVGRHPKAETVSVPHTWNLVDVFDGMKYERGTYLYERLLKKDASLKGKRVFLRFDGVNSFAEIAVNQQYVGHHAGGYTAFCLEITDFLKEGDNKLTVVASNAYRTDVAPLAGDFNMYGGITRPVYLIVTGEDCISPLDYGSSGVYVHQKNISRQQAQFDVETMLSLCQNEQGLTVRTSIVDAAGQEVARKESAATGSSVVQSFTLENPHLWNGRQNPYRYRVRVELLKGTQVVDCVEEQTGFRFFSCDADKGFFLNGQHLDLHGVCRHEEGYQTAGLYNEAAMREDADLIYKLGCTGVRFVHYPHSKYDVQMYDERGIVLWYELNLAGPGGYNSPGYMKNPQLESNVMRNLTEMIKQNYNSPAICFWSLCNELSFKYDEPATFLRQLNAKAKALDPQRLTTLAICYSQDKFQGITDTFGWNKYFGFYENQSGVGEFFDQAKIEANGIPMGLCEYGAAGSPNQHGFEKIVTNKIHYEENQARVHEENWRDMSTRDYAWCKFIWQFSDNPSSIRYEGDRRGMNDKGIVTYDRKTLKDAYFFYQANWSTEPMVYIAARRYTKRTDALTDVKIYTNQPQAVLYLNGKKVGKGKRDAIGRIIFKDVTLREGENVISVKAGKLSDECRCTLDSSAKQQDGKQQGGRLDGAVN